MALLLEDYDFFVRDSDFFCQRLQALTELRGKAVVGEWIEKVKAGQTHTVVLELLTRHCDPMYAKSIERNFKQYGQALACVLADRSPSALAEMACELLTVKALLASLPDTPQFCRFTA